jgi:metal-dependent amidase/aminoacylase/carboxypeptidase family protein
VILSQFLGHTRLALLEASSASGKTPVVILDEVQTLLHACKHDGHAASVVLQAMNYLCASAALDDASGHVILVGDATLIGA